MYNTTPHPLADTSDSPSEYAVALQKKRRLRTTYDLVRDKVSQTNLQQKQLYNQRVHGKPYKPGDLVWLHSNFLKRVIEKSFNIYGLALLK